MSDYTIDKCESAHERFDRMVMEDLAAMHAGAAQANADDRNRERKMALVKLSGELRDVKHLMQRYQQWADAHMHSMAHDTLDEDEIEAAFGILKAFDNLHDIFPAE